MSMSKKSESKDREEHEVATMVERWDAMVVKRANQEEEASSSAAGNSQTDLLLDSEVVQNYSNKKNGASPPSTKSHSREKSSSAGSTDTTQFSISYQTTLSVPGRRRKPGPPVDTGSQGPTTRGGPSVSAGDAASTKSKPLDSAGPKEHQRNGDTDDQHSAGRGETGTKDVKPQASDLGVGGTERQDHEDIDKDSRSPVPIEPIQLGATGDESQAPASEQESEEEPGVGESDTQEAGEKEKPETPDGHFQLPTFAKLISLGTEPKSTPDQRSDLALKEEVPDQLLDPVIPGFAERVDSDPPQSLRSGYRSSIFIGFLLLFLGFGGFGVWSALAPLRSGTMAPGVVKLAGERKTIQHLEGGIVEAILVKEGDAVEAGQVLVRLDEKKASSSLAALTAEYHALLARQARLRSEKFGLEAVHPPEELLAVSGDPDIKELIEGEQSLFSARRTSINDQLNVFDSWQKTYEQEISGLVAQRSAAKKQLEHINDELRSVEILYKKGLIDKPKLLQLKRTAAGLTGRVGAFGADIARAKQKIGEAKLRAISLQTQQQEQVSADLQEIQTSILTLEERMQAARDIVKRLNITAPRSGRVVGLRFHTPGGVISPSTPILDIVPEDDKLIVEASINPIDIDIVVPGMEAQIQLTAYSMRKTPPLPGKVLQVSADRIDDPKTGEPFYISQVEIDPEALKKLEGVKLYPGMPASVQIVTGERTALDYLLSPIQAGLRRTWLEE